MAHSASIEESSQGATVSEAVVSAVAELTGTDPLSLDPLYTAVDPDALNALFSDGSDTDRSNRVEFTYSGCHVVVTPDGDVRVSKADQETVALEEWR